MPDIDSILIDERASYTLSVNASDPNTNDVLHYRWYVNEELVFDEGDTFFYTPKDLDGSIDGDGAGPLKPGQHNIKVEVTDGNNVITKSWIANVRNLYLVPELAFNVRAARLEAPPIRDPQNINWSSETIVHTEIGNENLDYLFFSGDYVINSELRHFVWIVQFFNGQITKPNGSLSRPPWNFYENIPWSSGVKTTRVSYNFVTADTFDFLLTPQTDKMGPYNSITNSIKLRGDLTSLSVPLSSVYRCIGTCARGHYGGDGGYGNILSETYFFSGTHTFWVKDNKDLYWDLNSYNEQEFHSVHPNTVWGMGVNESTKRLYVSVRNMVDQVYQLLIFNISPVEGGNPPTLVTTLNVYDGNPDHIDSMPSEIVVDESTNRIFVYLAGTGGVALLTDDGTGTPVNGDLTYIGVDRIGSSQTDLVNSGRKFGLDLVSNLLIGITRVGRQVFTIDLDTYTVYTVGTDISFDSIQIVPESNLVILIDRGQASLYRVQ